MLTSKIITESIETHFEFSGCANIAAINLFRYDFDKPWNYLWNCYEKTPQHPLPPFWKGGRGNDLDMPSLSSPPGHSEQETLKLQYSGVCFAYLPLGQNLSLGQTFLATQFFSLYRYFIETTTTDIDVLLQVQLQFGNNNGFLT